ncbi:MAG: ABC transporter substrate-binding protein [Deltaproteobacteria bacterium]|nr:ABC transporter substrate-binding protein [Deltaproteobacteria bacterium]
MEKKQDEARPSALEALLGDGKKISRREFMERAAALGVSLSVASSLWARSVQAAKPKRGGKVTVAVEETSQAETYDPTKMVSGSDAQRAYQVYNRLTNLDRNLKVVPNLAVEWEGAKEYTEWTFKLRKGVEFHNGKTLTSKDVIYSLGEHIKEGSRSPSRTLLAPIVDMKADGNDVVKITLKDSNVDFPVLLGFDYHTSIVVEGWKDGDPVVGTGPYKLVEFKPGLRSVVVRNENYFKSDAAWVDTFITQGVADATARSNGLRTGDIDMAQIDPRIAHLLGKAPNVNVHSTPAGQHFLWAMMCDRPPTNDLNVRLALKHCAKRQSMVDKLLHGNGVVANDFGVNPRCPMYCKEIPQHDYDPDKARFYWKKTGLSGIEVVVSNAAGDFAIDATLMLKESAKAAGIDIKVKRVAADGYWDHTWMKVPMCASNWNSRPTADLMLTLVNHSDAEWNETQWKNKRFDELLVLGRKTADPVKRYEIYCEACTLLHDLGGSFIPFFYNFVEGVNSRIQGYRGSPAFTFGAGWIYEEVWVDESMA